LQTYAISDISDIQGTADVCACVCVTDMGLARSIWPGALNATSVTTIAGTNGYIDRHYEHTGRYDVMCDEGAQWPDAVAIELHKIGMGLVEANRARRMTVPDARARLQVLVEAHLRAADAPDTVERECVVCMSAPRALRFSVCGHSALCRGCAGPFMQRARASCPHCRSLVSQQGLIESDDVAREPTFMRPLRA
jgi:hypothetical protein